MSEDTNIDMTFYCECKWTSHMLRIDYVRPDNSIYLSTYLNPTATPFWRRLRTAIRYVFGLRTMRGGSDFDEFIVDKRDIIPLANALTAAHADMLLHQEKP